MTEAERSKYDGRDMVILNRHTEDTIQEDKLSFPMQMENHFAHVRPEPFLRLCVSSWPRDRTLQAAGRA